MAKLGITNDFISLPLTYSFSNSQQDHPFELYSQSLEQNCKDLLHKKLDIAFISAVDYARHSSELLLIKDFAIYTRGACKCALLVFEENLLNIHRVAFLRNSQYQILADLVLKEYFEIESEWRKLDAPDSIAQLPQKAPIFFLDGNSAIENASIFENHLDIAEEWSERSGLSYIHQLLAVRRDTAISNFLQPLAFAYETGMKALAAIAKAHAATHKNDWEYYYSLLTEIFQYRPTEVTWEDVQAYLEYLYYHGNIDFIPELHF